MSQTLKKKGRGRKITSIVLFAVAGVLILAAVGGYFLRGTEATRANLNAMRTQAVLHTASDGLLDAIASRARSEKLKELSDMVCASVSEDGLAKAFANLQLI